MNITNLKRKISTLALSMFRKDFFGIYHGSISAKTESNRFIINTQETIFDAIDDDNIIELHFKRDYRWNQASIDASIHFSIYSQISEAKFICFTMPPFTTAYSLDHNIVSPKDYFGHQEIGSIEIVDPKQFDDWYDRAQSEIAYYFQTKKTNIIKMAKQLAILEKSCRLLMLESSKQNFSFE